MQRLITSARWLRAVLWTTFSVVVIGVAIAVGIAKLLLPYADTYRHDVEQWIGEKLHSEVTIDALAGRWSGIGPHLELENVRIVGGDQGEVIVIERAGLSFDIYAWLLPGREFIDFTIHGAHMSVTWDEQGSLVVEGLGMTNSSADRAGSSALLSLASLHIVDSQFSVRSPDGMNSWRLHSVDLVLSNDGERLQLSGRALPSGDEHSTIEMRAILRNQRSGEEPAVRLYLKGEEIPLAPLLGPLIEGTSNLLSGKADLELWYQWDGGRGHDLRGSIEGHRLSLEARDPITLRSGVLVAPRFLAEEVAADFQWQVEDDVWAVELSKFTLQRAGYRWPEGRIRLLRTPQHIDVKADYLRAEDIVAGMLAGGVVGTSAAWLYQADPGGDVHQLVARLDLMVPPYRALELKALVSGAELVAVGKVPGFAGLDGTLNISGPSGTAQIESRDFWLDYDRVFREVLHAPEFAAELQWLVLDDSVRLWLDNTSISNADLQAQVRLYLDIPRDGSRPFVDLTADLAEISVPGTNRYWPINVYPETVLRWLDRALISGTVSHGKAQLFGDLKDWPFRNNEGKFEVRASVEGATLDYHSGWPKANALRADLLFDRTRMEIDLVSADLLGNRLSSGHATIAEMKRPVLEVFLRGSGILPQPLKVLQHSPLEQRFATFYDAVDLTGTTDYQLALTIPLAKSPGEVEVTGQVQIKDGTLQTRVEDLFLDQINGQLLFDETGFHAEEMTSSFRGYPMQLSVRGGTDAAEPGVLFDGRMVGEVPPEAFLAQFSDLAPIGKFVDGAALWNVRLVVDQEEEQYGTRLLLQSELEGTQVTLPLPLQKERFDLRSLEIEVPIPTKGRQIAVRYGEDVRMALRLPDRDTLLSGVLRFGDGEITEWRSPGLRIEGETEDLDVWGWLLAREDLMPAQPGQENLVREIELSADRLLMMDKAFHETTIHAQPEPPYWRVDLAGKELEGMVRLPLDAHEARSMTAQFERLWWPATKSDDLEQALDPAIRLDPRTLPELHLYVADLVFGGVELGEVRLESFGLPGGMRFQTVETRSDSVEIRANGDWTLDESGEHSTFKINLTAESLGKMLDALGYQGLVQDGQTVVHMDVSWDGTPTQFALSRLTGSLDVSIGTGQFLEIKPGAGRIFGLFSLRELPRRLLFDFTDLFQKGLTFDAITGSFALGDGAATTDDLLVKARSADLLLVGRTSLVEQTYAQELVVIPKVGQSLPVVGALAAGPAGAAAMLAVQSIFGRQLEEITQYRYAVSGPWDEPEVELLGATSRSLEESERNE